MPSLRDSGLDVFSLPGTCVPGYQVSSRRDFGHEAETRVGTPGEESRSSAGPFPSCGTSYAVRPNTQFSVFEPPFSFIFYLHPLF